MYFGVDYYPEQWVFPYDGTAENPEAAWERDAELMVKAGINVVRIGEFSWGLCEPEDGTFDFGWLQRVMDIMGNAGIQIVLGTPTAAPPIWLTKKHPEILPLDEYGRVKHEGTRRAVCLNSDVFWNYSRRIVENMAKALGKHPQLIAWQIDNGIGGNFTESSFNEDTRLDWHAWLEAKYETVERMNKRMGLRHWGQVVTSWDQVPMPMHAPAAHNPALVLDWCRFCSDTIVQFVKMQADLLHELTPKCPVTDQPASPLHRFDHFDLAEVIDFVSIESNASIKTKSSELACEIDMLRSLKKTGVRTPDGDTGFWVMEQKAGQVNWQDVNSLVRPGVLRMFTYQLVSRGATAILFFRWRQPRIGSEKFYGAVLPHHLEGQPDLSGNQPDWRRTQTARARAQGHQGRGRGLHSLQPRQRLGAATAEPAEQIFQPARAHPAHLQCAARPQHPGGFRAPGGGSVEIQTRHRPVAPPAGRR